MDPIWEEPPEKSVHSHAWMVHFVDELKRNPGKWARVRRGNGQFDIPRSSITQLRLRGAAVTTRAIDDETGIVGAKNKCWAWAKWPK